MQTTYNLKTQTDQIKTNNHNVNLIQNKHPKLNNNSTQPSNTRNHQNVNNNQTTNHNQNINPTSKNNANPPKCNAYTNRVNN